jgi:hypothetical protein
MLSRHFNLRKKNKMDKKKFLQALKADMQMILEYTMAVSQMASTFDRKLADKVDVLGTAAKDVLQYVVSVSK